VLHHTELSRAQVIEAAVEALTDAADEDRATGGIDVVRGHLPDRQDRDQGRGRGRQGRRAPARLRDDHRPPEGRGMSTPVLRLAEQGTPTRPSTRARASRAGKPIVALEYDHGIVMMAENRSATLRKIAEIYDRIAFGASASSTSTRTCARPACATPTCAATRSRARTSRARASRTSYSTVLGSVFTREMKSLEVEILVVEIRETGSAFYQIRYDGSNDRHHPLRGHRRRRRQAHRR